MKALWTCVGDTYMYLYRGSVLRGQRVDSNKGVHGKKNCMDGTITTCCSMLMDL